MRFLRVVLAQMIVCPGPGSSAAVTGRRVPAAALPSHTLFVPDGKPPSTQSTIIIAFEHLVTRTFSN